MTYRGADQFPLPQELDLPERVADVNTYFTIKVIGGSHGSLAPNTENAQNNPSNGVTAIEYDEAARVVATLRPEKNDVLFIEGFGWNVQPPEPTPLAELTERQKQQIYGLTHILRQTMQNALSTGFYAVEDAREMQEHSTAWTVAESLAYTASIKTYYADLNAGEVQAWSLRTGIEDPLSLWRMDMTPEEADIRAQFQSQRNVKAVQTVIDYAGSNLPELGTPHPIEEDKPVLALLYGMNHEDRLNALFTGANIEVHKERLLSDPIRQAPLQSALDAMNNTASEGFKPHF